MRINQQFSPISSLVLLCLLLQFTGCARTPPVSYYQLVSQEEGQMLNDSSKSVDAVLGLGPVLLPQYLDQPKIVSRLSANRLQLSDQHRWVEPLGGNITRVIKEELTGLLHPKQILIYPWSRALTVDCRLVIEVLQFEQQSDGTAQLLVSWMAEDKDGNMVLPERQSSYRTTVSSSGQGASVRALNEAVNQFCHELAGELRPLLRKGAGASL